MSLTKKFLVLFAVLTVVMLTAFSGQALAQNGANKVHVEGSTVTLFGPLAPATILSTPIKTSTNADLILSLSSECAIAVSDFDVVTNGGSDTDSATAVVQVWVEVDGSAVPVNASAPTPDNGRIVLCRLDRSSTTFQSFSSFGGSTLVDNLFQATRTSNGFNWVARNVGGGTHTVDVKAQILHAASGSFTSFGGFSISNPPLIQGVVGRRMLIVEAILPQK